MIAAEIVADSLYRTRLTTFSLTYPRFIHSELMTHRVFARNAASSRAIPTPKQAEKVLTRPAAPLAFSTKKKGMQGGPPLVGDAALQAMEIWQRAATGAAQLALELDRIDVHKQHANRLLEPFVFMRTVVTATQWENFFHLRCSEHAQPEFHFLAFLMLRAYLKSEPVSIRGGDWHIPFGDRLPEGTRLETRLKVATARCCRTSYENHDGNTSVDDDMALYTRCETQGHWSPFEHCAQAMNGQGLQWSGPFKGWKQYRKFFPSENAHCNLQDLLAREEAFWLDQ